MALTVGSLFSGIGGLDLGLERAGMEVIWQSEIDPYACKVLSKHWPEVVNHGDIKAINWSDVVRPDVICGGYPCQPFSTAGKRRGEEDPRHLWPWVREAISQLRPKYAILENVRGHLSLGGVSVIGELADIGYDAEWRIVSAASVGAHHRRDRVVIVAYPNNSRPHRAQIYSAETRFDALSRFGRCGENVADTNGERLETERAQQQTSRTLRSNKNSGWIVGNTYSEGRKGRSKLQEQETQRGGLDQSSEVAGWSGIWEPEPNVGRVAHGVPSRVDRLRGLGNAVVPQVAEVIGRLVISDYQRRED
jgi:DNA (cytosine-5)-methyltransferase 1